MAPAGIDIELLNERGRWISYQVKRDYFNSDEGASSISLARKRIARLTQQQVNAFLASITAIKPFNDSTFKITPQALIADLHKRLKDTSKANIAKLTSLIYKESIQRAIKGVIQDRSVFDWSKGCRIYILKANGDTLKMQTTHLYTTMLPWTINNQDSYDVNINAFFIAAMGNQQYPNRETLDIANLEEALYYYLGGRNVTVTLKAMK